MMAVPLSNYSKGDEYEDYVNEMLSAAWNKPFTMLNRIKDINGNNKPQSIVLKSGKRHSLPDITVFYDSEYRRIEMRVEVKGFHTLPSTESPNPNLHLFPIKKRQLYSYWKIFKEEEINCRIIIVVKSKDVDIRYKTYWSDLSDMENIKMISSNWDNEPSFWFNIEDMHSDFSNF